MSDYFGDNLAGKAAWLAVASLILSACATPRPKAASASSHAPAPVERTASAPASSTPAASVAKISKSRLRKLPKIWGIVQSIDAENDKITLKDKAGNVREFAISEQARFTRGGDEKAIDLSQIKVGDRVTLRYKGDTAEGLHVNVLVAKS